MKKPGLYILCITLCGLILGEFLFSCGHASKGELSLTDGDTVAMHYARNITLVKYPGFVKTEIRNPWDTTKLLHTYFLIPDSAEVPEGLPSGTVLRTPLKKSLVYSSVHQSLIDELGATEAIKGIVDFPYITRPSIRELVETGEVTDCGTVISPNFEKIIELNPDAILLSPFADSGGYGKLGDLGVPLVECADYTENHPLGRTEWVKFFGMLYGKEDFADSLFYATESQYLDLKQKATEIIKNDETEEKKSRPKVLIDALYGQTWNMPGAGSLMDVFIRDAGGENPFRDIDKSFNIPLAGEKVLMLASDADIWLLRYWQDNEKTLRELGDENPLYTRFNAYKEGNVYGCNTKYVEFFEEVPYHPQRFLADLISLFHPELDSLPSHTKYYTKLR